MPILPIAALFVLRLDRDGFERDLRATVDALVGDGLTVQLNILPQGALLECFDVSGRELGRAQAYGVVSNEADVHTDSDDPGAEPDDGVELALSVDEHLAMLSTLREAALRRADAGLAASLEGQMQGLLLATRMAS